MQQQEIRQKQLQTGVAPETEIKEARKIVELSLSDPEAIRAKMIKSVHTSFGLLLQDISNMTPEEMQKAPSDDIAIMKGEFDSIIEPLLDQSLVIIAGWQTVGKYPADEISRMQADPAHFEKVLRRNLEELRDILLGIPKAQDGVAALGATEEFYSCLLYTSPSPRD